MRIGIDCQVLQQTQHTGIPNYVRHLKETLQKLESKHEFVFFDGPKGNIPFWSSHIAYAKQIEKARLNLFHGPANTLPLFYQGKSVITVHDLAIYKHPEWFPRGQWLSTKIVVPQSLKKARKIIVPSETTKQDLKDLFKVRAEKIVVIPHGVEERFFAVEQRPKQNFILFVGTLEPRKNLQRVIEAYQGLPAELKAKYELWVAGGKGWPARHGKHELDSGVAGGGVKYLNYVSYDELPTLYQNASLFVYPSLYEGFGLPVLEAAAAGCPVITSKNSAMAEFYPYSLVNPTSVGEIRNELARVLSDEILRKQMSEKGITLAKKFTWERTATETLQVYEEAVKN